jgi:hypothetical protein
MSFLSSKQISELKKNEWTVNPDGCWVVIYAKDFVKDMNAWKDMCEALGASENAVKLHVLAFGFAENHFEECDEEWEGDEE